MPFRKIGTEMNTFDLLNLLLSAVFGVGLFSHLVVAHRLGITPWHKKMLPSIAVLIITVVFMVVLDGLK